MSDFEEVILLTTQKLDECDSFMKNLIIGWLICQPHIFFNNLFGRRNTWNSFLLSILENAEIINGKGCAFATQAFCLWCLEQFTKNDNKYKQYNIKDIEGWIIVHIPDGRKIIETLNDFRKSLASLPPDERYLEYCQVILKILYNDHEKKNTIMDVLNFNSQLRLSLTIYSGAIIRSGKQSDLQDKVII